MTVDLEAGATARVPSFSTQRDGLSSRDSPTKEARLGVTSRSRGSIRMDSSTPASTATARKLIDFSGGSDAADALGHRFDRAGSFSRENLADNFAVVRLDANGQFDSSFRRRW